MTPSDGLLILERETPPHENPAATEPPALTFPVLSILPELNVPVTPRVPDISMLPGNVKLPGHRNILFAMAHFIRANFVNEAVEQFFLTV